MLNNKAFTITKSGNENLKRFGVKERDLMEAIQLLAPAEQEEVINTFRNENYNFVIVKYRRNLIVGDGDAEKIASVCCSGKENLAKSLKDSSLTKALPYDVLRSDLKCSRNLEMYHISEEGLRKSLQNRGLTSEEQKEAMKLMRD